jgi:uncharacterized protein (DUF2164 family)
MNKKQNQILQKQDQEKLIDELIKHFKKEFAYDLGNLEAAVFLEFLDETVGKTYYNQGVLAAIQSMKEKTDELVLLVREE